MSSHEEAHQIWTKIELRKREASPEMAKLISDAVTVAAYYESEPIDTGDESLNYDISRLRDYWQVCKVLGV